MGLPFSKLSQNANSSKGRLQSAVQTVMIFHSFSVVSVVNEDAESISKASFVIVNL